MKTLDEVIEELEDEGLFADALHYLRAYRENQQAYVENSQKAEEARERYLEAVKNCELAENRYRRLYEETSQKCAVTSQNDPLTWSELKQMEGKPVWVEVDGAKALHTSGWCLVGHTQFTTWAGVESCSLVKVGVTYALPIAEYGKTWTSFRKERE